MSQVLSSIGAQFGITNVTSGADTPTSFRHIPKIYDVEFPDLTPQTTEVTSYDNLKNTSSIPILSDTSSSYNLTARFTKDEDAETVWNDEVSKYEAGGKECYLCLKIRGAKSAYIIPIVPRIAELPSELPLNDAISIQLPYTIAGDIEKVEASSVTISTTVSD